MQPIISPWIIYAISVVGKLGLILYILTFVSICAVCLIALFILVDGPLEYDRKKLNKIVRSFIITLAIIVPMNVILPSQKTIMIMVGTRMITKDNVQNSKAVIEKVYGDIVDIIKDKKEGD